LWALPSSALGSPLLRVGVNTSLLITFM
jgi:hypothetical protein